MPTGYTAAIAKGIDFKTFAMDCARAFGACIELRDEPGGGEVIPERFEPSDFYRNALAKEEQDLAALDAMSTVDKDRAAAKAWDDAETARVARARERAELRSKYEAMLAQVQAFEPPTADHQGLKQFMAEQIIQSINFDCQTYSFEAEPAPRLTGETWAQKRRVALTESIERDRRMHAEEVQRAEQRTAWVKALRAALEGDAP
jgi:hypothetical protein